MEEQRPEAQQQHFLIVSFPFQGHVNPSLRLAKRLAAISAVAVTFSTTVSAHRRMLRSHLSAPDQEFHDGNLSYIPFSDGYDDGFHDLHIQSEAERFMAQSKLLGSRNVAGLVSNLAARGRPVTCVIYSPGVPWVADVARDGAIPSALFWIQSATSFAIFYHYFHGYDGLIAAHSHDPSLEVRLPALPPLKVQDLPSLVTTTDPDDPYLLIVALVKEGFDALDREAQSRWSKDSTRTKVLVNTFHALETDALGAATDSLDLVPIGPVAPPALTVDEKKNSSSGGNPFKADEEGYMEWLDAKPAKSVVYVAFGSLSVLKKRQVEEISHGLKESGRPYLWVASRSSGEGVVELEEEEGEEGMVVAWCDQVRVLSHPAVGCFVTHCGWNSTTESLMCGVPTVAVPQWVDQPTNARLMEEWGTGVRAVITAEEGGGVLEGRELRRCVDAVMGGEEIRRKTEVWRDRAREAISEGGSSDRNLRAFVEGMGRSKLAI